MSLIDTLGIFIVVVGIVIAIAVFYNRRIPRDIRFKLAMVAVLLAFLCLLTLVAHNIWVDVLAALSAIGLVLLMFRYFWHHLKNDYHSLISTSQKNLVVKSILFLKLSQKGQLKLSDKDIKGLEEILNQTSSARLAQARDQTRVALEKLTPQQIKQIQNQIDNLKRLQAKLRNRNH